MSNAEKAIDRTQLKISSIVDTSTMDITSDNYQKKIWYDKQNAMLAEKIKEQLHQKYGISYTEIKATINRLTAENNIRKSTISESREPIENLREMIDYCKIYMETYRTNERYEASKDPERYYENHDAALNAFNVAEDYLSRKGYDTSILRDKEKAEKFISTLQKRLEAAEDTVETEKEEIKKNEKAIAELRSAKKNLDRYHKKIRDEL